MPINMSRRGCTVNDVRLRSLLGGDSALSPRRASLYKAAMRRLVVPVCVFVVVWSVVALSGQQPPGAPAPGQPAGRGAQAPPPPMSFFITSVGLGKGGDLGGLAGADAHCQALAAASGRGAATWHAYLSTQGPNAVNARDRIGNGPWHSAAGNRSRATCRIFTATRSSRRAWATDSTRCTR